MVRPEPGKSEWQIRFPETNAFEIQAFITTRAPRSRSPDQKARTIVPVGPVAALNVLRQGGTIHVRSLPHLRATAILRGDTQRADGSIDPNVEAVYRYRMLPTNAKETMLAPLDLDIRAVPGVLQSRVHHYLQLGELGWKVRSDITVTPIRTEIDSIEMEVPIPGAFEASTPKLVEGIIPIRDIGANRRVVQIKLAAPRREEFSLTIEGTYPSSTAPLEALLVLPRLLGVFDRDDQVTVAIPEGMELRGGVYQWEVDKPGTRLQAFEESNVQEHSTTVATAQAASHVELSLHPVRDDVRIEVMTDVVLDDKQGQMTQHFHYHFKGRPPRKIRLRSSGPLLGVAISSGTIESAGRSEWLVNLPPDAGKEPAFSIASTFALSVNAERQFSTPLLWPDGSSWCQNRVRFLRDRDAASRWLPVLASEGWQQTPIELRAQQTTLLALRATGLNLPLAISVHDEEAGAGAMPLIVIDRALIQAQVTDAGQRYRARFHLVKWHSRTLDFDLPVNSAEFELRLNGVRAEVHEPGVEGDTNRRIRIPLPAQRKGKRCSSN